MPFTIQTKNMKKCIFLPFFAKLAKLANFDAKIRALRAVKSKKSQELIFSPNLKVFKNVH